MAFSIGNFSFSISPSNEYSVLTSLVLTGLISILNEISPEYLLEGLMLKLKLQSFGYLMQGADSLEKSLMLGKIKDRRRRR